MNRLKENQKLIKFIQLILHKDDAVAKCLWEISQLKSS